jgi:hypothetical protein
VALKRPEMDLMGLDVTGPRNDQPGCLADIGEQSRAGPADHATSFNIRYDLCNDPATFTREVPPRRAISTLGKRIIPGRRPFLHF